MTDLQLIQMIRTIALPLIVFLTVAIAARQVDRVMRHRLFGDESPEILIRDVLFFSGLAFLLVIPATAGIFGIVLGTVPLWILISTTIGVALLALIAYFEYFRIGKRR